MDVTEAHGCSKEKHCEERPIVRAARKGVQVYAMGRRVHLFHQTKYNACVGLEVLRAGPQRYLKPASLKDRPRIISINWRAFRHDFSVGLWEYEKVENVNYWLVKSEASVYSIDDLQSDRVTIWDGVRNYQARNYLRSMRIGDEVLFYHSNSEPNAVVGLAVVKKVAFADPTQFDSTSEFFEPKASPQEPRWFCPELKFVKKFKRAITLEHLKGRSELKAMALLQPGSRLSVQPVTEKEFKLILKLAE